jgi:hypothetical protein
MQQNIRKKVAKGWKLSSDFQSGIGFQNSGVFHFVVSWNKNYGEN